MFKKRLDVNIRFVSGSSLEINKEYFEIPSLSKKFTELSLVPRVGEVIQLDPPMEMIRVEDQKEGFEASGSLIVKEVTYGASDLKDGLEVVVDTRDYHESVPFEEWPSEP